MQASEALHARPLAIVTRVLTYFLTTTTLQVWDFQTKQCVQTMEGHTHNVATVCCHPELPIIMSGSEDGTLKIWYATTHALLP